MKIGIVGAGISGLSTYLFLKKLLPKSGDGEHDIVIYEGHPDAKRVPTGQTAPGGGDLKFSGPKLGGVLSIAVNGMNMIKILDPEIYEAVYATGYPTTGAQINNSWNWTLGGMPVGPDGQVAMVISRQGLWNCIRAKVPDDVLRCNMKVKQVVKRADGKLNLEFDSGHVETVDLVIGADGVKSKVKEYVVGEGYASYYEGVVGMGGFVSTKDVLPDEPEDGIYKLPKSPVKIILGREGFFSYIPVSHEGPHDPKLVTEKNQYPKFGPLMFWWSKFETDSPGNPKELGNEVYRERLIEEHGTWWDPKIQKLIRGAPIYMVLPTYVTPTLPTWANEGAVLVGDAAHTMPTTSAQGVSQAFEDAQSLALLLAHFLNQEDANASAISLALKAYVTLRKPRVDHILEVARKHANHKRRAGLFDELKSYLIIYIACLVYKGSWNNYLFNYKVEDEIPKALELGERYQEAYLQSLKTR